MNDTKHERLIRAFAGFENEVTKALNGIRTTPDFWNEMIKLFLKGYNANEALSKYFENVNKEIQKDILELTKQE